jgi:subtilisin family serine protease
MKHLVLLRVLFLCVVGVACRYEVFAQSNNTATPQAEPVYTLFFAGERQANGTFSPARFYPIYRTPKGTYLEKMLYVKTRERVPLGKDGRSLQSSGVMNVLQKHGIRSIAATLPNYNSRRPQLDAEGLGNVYTVRYDDNADVFDVCRELVSLPEVEYAEPIYNMQLDNDTSSTAARFVPNDPLYQRQYEWQRIDAERAWGVTTGSASVVIGIIDSGVDYEHEDLAPKLWTNPGETGTDASGRDRRTNGIDDDGNGRVDDWRGWDFANTLNESEFGGNVFRDDNDPKLRRTLGRNLGTGDGTSNHGTHVAGAAAAATNNGLGVAGACPNCSFYPIKTMSEDSVPSFLMRTVEAMNYMGDLGISVVNMSFGGRGAAPFSAFSAFTQGVINHATARGTLFVSSAGNNGLLMDDFNYPASYDNVFPVGNSTSSDASAGSSNFGVKTGVFAPGSATTSAFSDNQYQFLTGTSMSSPIVAGVAGLLRSQRPTWTPRQIMQQIRSTSDNTLQPSLGLAERSPFYYGRMNAFRALTFNNPLNQGPNVVPGLSIVGTSVSAENGLITGFQPVRLIINSQNFLSNASNVSVSITSLDGRALPVGTSTVNVGDINTMQQRAADFLVQLQPSAATGVGLRRADFLVTFRSGSYINYERISLSYNTPFTVNEPQITAATSVDFGAGAIPTTRTIPVRNSGNVPISFSPTMTAFTGANAAEFGFVTIPTTATVLPGQTLNLNVRFVPSTIATGVGNRTAALTVSMRTVTTDVVTTLQRTVQLTGLTRLAGVLNVTPVGGLAFGTVTIATSQILRATFANTSAFPVTIRSSQLIAGTTVTSEEYQLLDQLPSVIAPRTSATIRVQFTPSATSGTRAAALQITTDTEPIVIALSGAGSQPAAERQPRVLSYGFVGQADFVGGSNIFSRFDQQPLGTINPLRLGDVRIANDIQVRNRGTLPLTITGATFSGIGSTEFTITAPTFPITLQPNQSTTLTVRYAPTIAGEKFTSVTFLVDPVQRSTFQQDILVFGSVGGIPRLVPITVRTGTDVITGPVRQLHELPFPLTALGTSATQTFGLRNPSTTASIVVSSVQFSRQQSSDYSITAPTQFPVTIEANGSVPLTVRFSPSAMGRRLAQMTVNYDAAPRSETVLLNGSGSARRRLTESIGFRLLNFGNVTTGQISVTSAAVTFFNDGSEPIRVTSVTIEGTNSAEFRTETLAMPTPLTLAQGQTFIVRTLFAPTSLGNKVARLVIQNDANPISIELRGTGVTAALSASVEIDAVQGNVGQIVEVPILLRNRRNFPNNATIFATLSFDANAAEPTDAAFTGILEDNRRIIPLTLNSGGANDSVLARVRLRVRAGNAPSSLLTLTGLASQNAVVTGRSGLLTIADFPSVSIPAEISARPGETVTLTVTARNRQNILAGRTFTTTLNFNASLLQPTNAANAGTVANGRRTLTFSIPAGAAQDSTWQVPLRATLGNDSTTTLQLVTVSPSGFVVPSQGRFRLTGLNQAGSPPWRFFSDRAGLAIVSTSPNPTSNLASVVYNLFTDDEVSLLVNDVYGRTLDEIMLGTQKAGTYTAEAAMKNLPTGTYFLTLRGKTGTATTVVNVVK